MSKKELAKNAPGPFFMRPYFGKDNDGGVSLSEFERFVTRIGLVKNPF